LIVSNSAGTADDPDGREASLLEAATGVTVLRHSTKKPGCGAQVLNHFRNAPDVDVTSPSQIAVVGDRIFTDVMMANMMGSWGVWVKDGVVQEKNFVSDTNIAEFFSMLKPVASSPDGRAGWRTTSYAKDM
jgi:phosphatidylglycerophosphatase GEP4